MTSRLLSQPGAAMGLNESSGLGTKRLGFKLRHGHFLSHSLIYEVSLLVTALRQAVGGRLRACVLESPTGLQSPLLLSSCGTWGELQ